MKEPCWWSSGTDVGVRVVVLHRGRGARVKKSSSICLIGAIIPSVDHDRDFFKRGRILVLGSSGMLKTGSSF